MINRRTFCAGHWAVQHWPLGLRPSRKTGHCALDYSHHDQESGRVWVRTASGP